MFEAAGDVTVKVVDNAKQMPDVKDSDWFVGDVVDFATARGIVNGVPQADGTLEFQGNLGTDRAMFVKMLHNLELNPEAASGESLGDVSDADWFADAAAWAVEAGSSRASRPIRAACSAAGTRDPRAGRHVPMRYADYLGMDVSKRAEVAFPDAGEVSGWALRGHELGRQGLFAGNSVRRAQSDRRRHPRQIATVLMRFIVGMYA